MKKETKDLTVGSIAPIIITFALPILAEHIFQTLYNGVDALVVGRAVGKIALAAVTSCNDISQLIVGFFIGLSSGAGVLISHYYGAKNSEKLHDAIHTTVLFSIIIGVSFTIIGIALAPTLLHLFECPEDVYSDALMYLRIYLLGAQFTAIYNIGSGILRACGDSKNPLEYLIISSVINVVLDVLFVVVFKLGVIGVAVATIISQLTSVLLVYRKMITTSDAYKLNLKELRIDYEILRKVMVIGFPTAIQTSLINLSNLFIQRYVNICGSAAMAGVGAAKKIDKFLNSTSTAIAYATSTFVAQNYGAKKYERLKKGIWTCLLIGISSVMMIGVVIYTFRYEFISLFTNDIEAINIGTELIATWTPLYFIQVSYHVISYASRGFGRSFASMMTNMIGLVLVRQMYLAYVMSIEINIKYVFISYPVGWIATLIVTVGYYLLFVRPDVFLEE